MVLAPLRNNPSQVETVSSDSVPPPISGWNARDSVADMAPTDAILLDNWFPRNSDIALFSGSEDHTTGIVGAVETLMSYSAPAQLTLLAFANGEAYDITVSGPVGAPLATGYTNNRWQYVNYSTAGGYFIRAVNGQDDPIIYDGTTISNANPITGPTDPAKLIHVMAHKRRIYYIEDETLGFWYQTAADAVGGVAAFFDLGPVFSLGGQLTTFGSWTLDSGEGVDDLAVFISSEGEVAVYSGSDPGDAATWALIGVFAIGRPVGRRSAVKIASDLIVITEDGYVPISRALAGARTSDTIALSDRISGAVSDAIQRYESNFGWQIIHYPKSTLNSPMAIVNVPTQENGTAQQHIVNLTTKAWCRRLSWDASCWVVHDGMLYYGGNTIVRLADTGTSDNGENIQGDAKQAFNYFSPRSRLKTFTMARPIIGANGDLQVNMELNVDFEDRPPTNSFISEVISGAEWDEEFWDTVEWSDEETIFKTWQTVNGVGYAAAIRLRVITNSIEVSWKSMDYMFKVGGRI